LRNFVKYLFREMILLKFREISQNIFLVSLNFVAKLALQSEISRNYEMNISRNFVLRNFANPSS